MLLQQQKDPLVWNFHISLFILQLTFLVKIFYLRFAIPEALSLKEL